MLSKDYFFCFRGSDVEISSDEIIEFLYTNHEMAVSDLRSIIMDFLANVPDSYEYRGELRVFYNPVFIDDSYILRIMNTDFRLNEVLYNEMIKSEMAALFVCTAGNIHSEMSTRYNDEGNYILSYIANLAGNIAVRNTALMIHSRFTEEAAKQGMKTTNYYCPGNCGWSIDEQEKVFMLVNGDFSGVKLSAENIMRPLKSLSGIIGIGENVFFRENTCELCGNENCIYRNKTAQR
ncbi:MAG: hypothetical protein JW965_01405 [Bacteroidales bacterium]|nr:hypothetical protein [Bacteroidales bacterium]